MNTLNDAQIQVTTTAGQVFTADETRQLAWLIYKRFGWDPDDAVAAWRRMLGNTCSRDQFLALAIEGTMQEASRNMDSR